MAAMDSLQNEKNPNGSQFSDYTMVYFDLIATGLGKGSEVCQIGAHFGESSFSRYICPDRGFAYIITKQSKLSKKDGLLYLEGERVETVPKMVAWQDFLQFLRSANNSVVLVFHNKHNDWFLLFRDLSELSLIDEFRKVCAGLIDTLQLCRHIFPGRKEIGKNYKLMELVKDELGEGSPSHNATVAAVNLEKLMNHANVQPEMFRQHFCTLFDSECRFHRSTERALDEKARKAAEAKIIFNDKKRSFVESEEDSSEPLLSGGGEAATPQAKRKKTSAITVDVNEQGTAEDSLQNNENPNGSHNFSDHTKVYIDLKTTGYGSRADIYQIGAHFADNSFSRYLCPNEKFAANQTGVSKKDCIRYIGGERVEAVSKMDALKDFLKFLQTANNNVVLLTHHRLNGCFLLFRDLLELSLMEEFRKVCVGVVDTLPLCTCVFPERKELGKKYRLDELVKDELGEDNLSHDATVIAGNLEKLMKHANVQPEMFQQHFYSLSDLEFRYQKSRAPKPTKAGKPEDNRMETIAITPDVSKQGGKSAGVASSSVHDPGTSLSLPPPLPLESVAMQSPSNAPTTHPGNKFEQKGVKMKADAEMSLEELQKLVLIKQLRVLKLKEEKLLWEKEKRERAGRNVVIKY